MRRSKEFQQIIELVDLITKYKVRQVEVIGNTNNHGSEPSKYRQLYDLVADGKAMNDTEAAALFSLDVGDRKYKRLREGLVNRLLNTLVFVDLSDYKEDEYQVAHYKCFKEFIALRILKGKGARVSGLDLARKLIKKCLKYDFTFLILEVSAILKRYYSVNPEYHKQYDKYNSLMWEYFEKRKFELQAYESIERLQIPYSVSKVKHFEIINSLSKDIKRFEEIPKEKRTLDFNYHFFLIRLFYSMTKRDWKSTVEYCEEAITFFDNTVVRLRTRPFFSQMSLCLIMLKDYEKAEESIGKAIELTTINSTNWFKIHEIKVLLYCHWGKYTDAYNVFTKIRNHPRKESISEPDRESWIVYEAYLNLLLSLGKIKQTGKRIESNKKFRISKMMNEIPVFSKDKRGMNLPVIIIHFLFLLFENKYEEADFRIEAIMKYYQRHLKSDDQNYRSNCFLKMLECIRKAGFNKEKSQQKAKKWKQKLGDGEISLLNQVHEIEIIPYETLWQFCLECLEEGNRK